MSFDVFIFMWRPLIFIDVFEFMWLSVVFYDLGVLFVVGSHNMYVDFL